MQRHPHRPDRDPDAQAGHQDPAGHQDVRAQPLGGRRAVPRLRARERQRPPYATAGTVLKGECQASLPMSNEVLLTRINGMVDSVNPTDLSTVVSELGTMFRGTAGPAAAHGRLRHRSSSTTPPRTPRARSPCSTPGTPCCAPRRHTRRTSRPSPRAWPTSPARCAPPTPTCARSCRAVRQRSTRSTTSSRVCSRRCRSSSPTSSPPTRCWSPTCRRSSRPWSLFPHVIAAGFTGTPGDSYGHINLQFNSSVRAVHRRLQAAVAVAASPATSPTGPVYPAQCKSGIAVGDAWLPRGAAVRVGLVAGSQLSCRSVRCPVTERSTPATALVVMGPRGGTAHGVR